MTHLKPFAAALALAALLPSAVFAQKRPLAADDVYNVRDVRDPQRSPDGKWVAYVVSRAIKDTDKNDSDVWMVSWDGTQDVQLTSTPDGESTPRWSPDNKYLAFLSSRQGAKGGQVWLLNRVGGEAVKLTEVKGGVSDYAWSPDSRRLVLVVNDPDPRVPQDDDDDNKKDADKKKTTPPIVIDRYHFKQDVSGYQRGERTHLYLFDVAAKKAEILTPGTFDDENPAWSPDSAQIAFVSKRGTGDLDRNDNSDVFVVDARAGAQPRQLTTSAASDGGRVSWSPDGKQIAYFTGDEIKYYAYRQNKLALVPAAGGEPRILTGSLDRAVENAVWAKDGSAITLLVEDDRSQYPARVALPAGRVERLIDGPRVVSNLTGGADGAFAALSATDTELPEVAAFEPGSGTGASGTLRRLTHHNDAWLGTLLLGTTEEFTSTSKDGTEVHGLIVKPATYQQGQKYPTLLRIHGGPNGQDEHSFSFDRELFAASGYVVVAVNYRGSSGRGSAYQKAIFADWGGKEVIDLVGAMDYVQQIGLADPDRLGIGGWSYGGILTDYTIATDGRFK